MLLSPHSARSGRYTNVSGRVHFSVKCEGRSRCSVRGLWQAVVLAHSRISLSQMKDAIEVTQRLGKGHQVACLQKYAFCLYDSQTGLPWQHLYP